jgi:hypothetical protein
MSTQAKTRISNVLAEFKAGRISKSNAYHLICNIIAGE